MAVRTKYGVKMPCVGITFHPDVIAAINKKKKKTQSRSDFVNKAMAKSLGVELVSK